MVLPLQGARGVIEGKDKHTFAKEVTRLKGFIPGNNIWYTKAAMDHLIWHNVMESLSPGYLNSMERRTQKEFGQEWWWGPGESTPERPPNIGAMTEQ